MKAFKKYVLYVAVASTMFACKKEHLQQGTTTNGTPVFYFNGTVNGAPFNVQAGVSNYYMYSSYEVDSGLLNFVGTLAPTGCNGCANTIKIAINDFTVEANASVNSFDTGSYLFLSPTGGVSNFYSVTFNPNIGYGTPTNYFYNFGDGATYSGGTAIQTHIYRHAGVYTANLIVNFGGWLDTIQSLIQANTPSSSFRPKLSIVYYDSLNSTIGYKDDTAFTGSHVTHVQWSFGDGSDSIVYGKITDTHQYPYHGEFHVSAKMIDSINNRTNTNFINVIARDSPIFIPYISNVSLSPQGPVANPKALANINITYTDANGDVYSSAKVAQPLASYFHILSVANYTYNENNQSTKKLTIQFSCLLKDGSGNTIPITNGQAVIAVAYK